MHILCILVDRSSAVLSNACATRLASGNARNGTAYLAMDRHDTMNVEIEMPSAGAVREYYTQTISRTYVNLLHTE